MKFTFKGEGMRMYLTYCQLLCCVAVVLVFCDIVSSDLIAISQNNTNDQHVFKDRDAEWSGYRFFERLGKLSVAVPRNACTPIQHPPPIYDTYFVLVDMEGCSPGKKVNNAEIAGYHAVVVKNVDESLPTITDEVVIDTVAVSKSTGLELESKYLYNKGYYISIKSNYFNYPSWGQYLIPFLVIIGVSLVLMMMFMIAKYYRQRIRERRNRLTPAKLKKIPTKKFVPGDDYDVCAICLDEYKQGDKLRILPCDHAYHSKCVDPWLTEGKRTCPVCKRPVFVDKDKRNESTSGPGSEEVDANERTPLIFSPSSSAPPLTSVEIT